MDRISKENYYLDIAESVLERSTCLRRMYGAIIVKNDEIISTGYNGAPRGRKNCSELGFCARQKLNIKSYILLVKKLTLVNMYVMQIVVQCVKE